MAVEEGMKRVFFSQSLPQALTRDSEPGWLAGSGEGPRLRGGKPTEPNSGWRGGGGGGGDGEPGACERQHQWRQQRQRQLAARLPSLWAQTSRCPSRWGWAHAHAHARQAGRRREGEPSGVGPEARSCRRLCRCCRDCCCCLCCCRRRLALGVCAVGAAQGCWSSALRGGAQLAAHLKVVACHFLVYFIYFSSPGSYLGRDPIVFSLEVLLFKPRFTHSFFFVCLFPWFSISHPSQAAFASAVPSSLDLRFPLPVLREPGSARCWGRCHGQSHCQSLLPSERTSSLSPSSRGMLAVWKTQQNLLFRKPRPGFLSAGCGAVGGGMGVLNLFIRGQGIVYFVCVCARASELVWKAPRVYAPWQRLLFDSCSSCSLRLEVKGEGHGKQVSPLCECSPGGSKHLAVERGRRVPAVRRWRTPREPGGWAVDSEGEGGRGISPSSAWVRALIDRLNKDAISQSLGALGFYYCLLKNQLCGRWNTSIFLHFCTILTSGPFPCAALNLGCVELIGVSMFENEQLTQFCSSQIPAPDLYLNVSNADVSYKMPPSEMI